MVVGIIVPRREEPAPRRLGALAPTEAFAYSVAALSALGPEPGPSGRLADVLELARRLEDDALLLANGRIAAAQVRHMAARVAAACASLAVRGDQRCGLPSLEPGESPTGAAVGESTR